MKRVFFIIAFLLSCLILVAQKSRIVNVRTHLSTGYDTMVVNYDLKGKRSAFNVNLEVSGENEKEIVPKHLSGDFGDKIYPGNNKAILWNLAADKLDLSNQTVNVTVVGDIFVPGKGESSVWIPWLYIASGICAITGGYAQIRANRLYEDYNPATATLEAEKIRKDVDRMLMVRNIALPAAAGFGVAGVVVHIRHIQKKNEVALNYMPFKNGASLSLIYKF